MKILTILLLLSLSRGEKSKEIVDLHIPALPIGCRKEGEIAFTFDQGPSQYTGLLLSTLARYKVRGTFHVSPDYLHNPVMAAYLRRCATEGHLVGLFVKESIAGSDDAVRLTRYLRESAKLLRSLTNYEPTFLRFPVPGPSPTARKVANSLGFRVTSYNLDSLDYNYVDDVQTGNQGQIYQTFKTTLDEILPPSRGSFIAVQRDIVRASVDQTDAILNYTLKVKGYKAVRLDDCIAAQGKEAAPGQEETGNPNPTSKDDNTNSQGKNKAQSNDASNTGPKLLLLVILFQILIF